MHRHLLTSFEGNISTVVFSVQRPQSIWINGIPSSSSVLNIHIPRKHSLLGINNRTIRSTRLVLANLLAAPVASTFIIITPSAAPSTKANADAPVSLHARGGNMGARTSSVARHRTSQYDSVNMSRQSSMPQLVANRSEPSWSMNGRQTSLSSTGLPRSSRTPSPRSMQPFQSISYVPSAHQPIPAPTEIGESYGPLLGAQDRVSPARRRRSMLASSTDCQTRNTLKKRRSHAGSPAHIPDSARASFPFASQPRNGHGKYTSKSVRNDSLQPARPVVLTTSRTSQTCADRAEVPEHLRASTKPQPAPRIASVSLPDNPCKDDETQNAPNSQHKRHSGFITAATAYIKKRRAQLNRRSG